jgi:hypothetical protein
MPKKYGFIIAFLIIAFYNAYSQENPDINHFVIYWKGFDISIEEIYNRALFIKNHGEPVQIYEEPSSFDDVPRYRLY